MGEHLQLETRTGRVRSTSSNAGTEPKPIDFSDVFVIGLNGGGGGSGGALATGVTPLVNGQAYIDVVFPSAQPDTSWYAQCSVVNTVDAAPLNISPGVITSRATTGFRIQLNGLPDSNNYVLHWAISRFVLPAATTYLLSGPSSGTVGAVSTPFTVQLPPGTSVPAPVTVTPSAGAGGGTFAPTSVTLTTAAPSATFTYTPASAGSKTISATNDGALANPASITFTATAGYSTNYALTGPSSGKIGIASTNFTVALPGGGSVAGTVTVTPSDGGAGGTFTPATVGLTTGAPSATFTYTPASYGAKTISVTNSGGLTNPANLTYTSVAGTYTLSGPSTGAVGVASTNFTVALPAGGVLLSAVTVTPGDAGGGGTFTPTTVNLTTGAPSATFTYTPASSGAKTISVTNSGGLTNPANLTYTASVAGPALLTNLISYWKLDEASTGAAPVARNDSKGTNHLDDTPTQVASAAGKINNGGNFVTATLKHLMRPSNSTLQVTSDFTFSVWAKLASIPGASGYIVLSKDSGVTGQSDYGIVYHPTVGYFFAVTDPSTIAVAVGTPSSVGAWTHIVVWWDSADSKLRIRINDTTTTVSSMTGALTASVAPFYIGAQGDGVGGIATNTFDGVIDEVGFWKRKLTAAEITQLYNGGAGWPFSSFT